jgi:CubicO group peptidase (beta-lactamase class C family)
MKSSIFLCLLFSTVIGFAQPNKININTVAPKIDALVQEYLDLDIFSGVVLVAEQGKPIYHKAFGLANREKKIPNTLNTKFDIGSMNKTFTKVLILQLLEAEKLQLTDPLGNYLTGFPPKSAKLVTIGHLLNHSSGYGDYFTEDYFNQSEAQKSIAGIVERVKKMPLLFEPGTEQEYSNAGYILLGAIIEKITGQSYAQNIKTHIIQPLQLKETYVENKYDVPNRAIGYYKSMRGTLHDNNHFLESPKPDGGFQSTALDILKFYQEFHYGTTLLKEESKRKDEIYNLIQAHKNTGGAIPHLGGFEGSNTAIYEILRDRITVLVFANMDEPVAEQIGPGILAIIRGKASKSPSLPAIQNVYKAYVQHGIEYVQQNFYDLIENFHPTDPKSLILNDIGYNFLEDNKVNKALDFFKLNTKLFPEDANVWDSLGEATLAAGDKKAALQHYQKALTIDPKFSSALEMIQQLESSKK